jgi:hypothetical protein
MSEQRQKAFQRNQSLEELLTELSNLLAPVEAKIAAQYEQPKNPVVFVVSAPRSGSTLMMQWLAATGLFAYPTNLMSRFYAAPYVGAKIQLLLTAPEYNYRNEILDFNQEIGFESHLGKTQGALAPNEFWYFWRRFFSVQEPRLLTTEEQAAVDGRGFVAELAAIESVFNKPLALKGMLLALNVPFLSGLFHKAIFLYIKRQPFYTIQSLLLSREHFYGSREKWYSIKPPQYDELIKYDPVYQVAGQVYFTTKMIEDGLAAISPERQLSVPYDAFCAHPLQVFDGLRGKYAAQGAVLDKPNVGQSVFQPKNDVRLSRDECNKVIEAYYEFSGEKLVT